MNKTLTEDGISIDLGRLPRHVAVIMDGNGRWAKKRLIPRVLGHREGVKSVRDIVKTCGEIGIEVLTLFAFSTENWSRPHEEVDELMKMLSSALRGEVEEMRANNVRLRASGGIDGLPRSVRNELSRAIKRLEKNGGLILNLALNYGARQEILDAVNLILKRGPRYVDEASFVQHLSTAGLPDPDLLIRTSGEMRVSNFLLWQIAYSEIYVTPTLWPDFRRRDLLLAIQEYQKRERRFGR